MMHFGGPVVPDEKRMNSGWLNGSRGQANSAELAAASSANRSTGIDSSGVADVSSSITTEVSDGSDVTSCSARFSSGAPSSPSSSIVGDSCWKRARMLSTPMSGAAVDSVAPSASAASPAMISVSVLNDTATTRSPAPSPCCA